MPERALQLIAENKAKYAQGLDARALDLSNCGLVDLPMELEEMIGLEQLILNENPPISIVKSDNQAILQYFEDWSTHN
jgi:Leucine-rich repeat (LRR) protein